MNVLCFVSVRQRGIILSSFTHIYSFILYTASLKDTNFKLTAFTFIG